jgi:hypothetical protein
MELKAPRAKLDWAVERLKALETECLARLEAEPFRVVPEFDAAIEEFVMRFRAPVDDWPQLRWGLMVGDVIHNARSALDQAVWLIALRTTPVEELWQDDVGWKIAFPVTLSESKFNRHRALPFLADDGKEVLRGVQPYQEGDIPEALQLLDRLWNIDKHRVIHGTTVSLDLSGVKFRPGALMVEDLIGEPPQTTWRDLPNPIPDGTTIASVRFRDGRGPPHTMVEVTGEPSVTLAFGGGFFALPIDGIGGLLIHTARILSLIEDLPEVVEDSA